MTSNFESKPPGSPRDSRSRAEGGDETTTEFQATDLSTPTNHLTATDPTLIAGKYRLGALLHHVGRTQTYDLQIDGGERALLRITRRSATSSAALALAPIDTDGTTQEIGEKVEPDPIAIEADVLSLEHPVTPRLIDLFRVGDDTVLVQSRVEGIPLLASWTDGSYSMPRKLSWLEQLRDLLGRLHERNLVLPTLTLDRLVVDQDGKLKLTDVHGACRYTFAPRVAGLDLRYLAPELHHERAGSEFRSDLFALGAIIQSLVLGRTLTDSDFQPGGAPYSLGELRPTSPPSLVRLVSKTFAQEPSQRFPIAGTQSIDPDGLAATRDALAAFARSARPMRWDVAGWSSTGLTRAGNEDCVTITRYSTSGGEAPREAILVCVADGMGGHAGGEVASAMAVQAVADYLSWHGLTAASLARYGEDHALADPRRRADLLRQAVESANDRIRRIASSEPALATMGCTLEVILMLGRRGVLCHVGDSRVYLRNQEGLRQLTRDQSIVAQLLERGRLTAEEAAVHPRRFELIQAVGAQETVIPARKFFKMSVGDRLLACSDGLSTYVSDADIDAILVDSSTAEEAARRLVNAALVKGGGDNVSVAILMAQDAVGSSTLGETEIDENSVD